MCNLHLYGGTEKMENGKKARASIKKDKFAGNSIFAKLYIYICDGVNRFSGMRIWYEQWTCIVVTWDKILLLHVRTYIHIMYQHILRTKSKWAVGNIVNVNKSWDFEREPEYYNYRSLDPETTVTIKASSLAPLPNSEDSVHSTVVNPPRARPGQFQQIPLVVGLFSHLM